MRRRAVGRSALVAGALWLAAPAAIAQPIARTAGARLEAVGDYEGAARLDEQSATASAATATEAAVALERAVTLRRALGNGLAARDDLELFVHRFGRDPAYVPRACALVLESGRLLEHDVARAAGYGPQAEEDTREAWAAWSRFYEIYLDRFAHGATLAQRVELAVTLGRAYEHLGDEERARRHFREAIELARPLLREDASDVALEGPEHWIRRGPPRASLRDGFIVAPFASISDPEFIARAEALDRDATRAALRPLVAEARYALARMLLPLIELPKPRYGGPPRYSTAYYRWSEAMLSPYLVAQRWYVINVFVPAVADVIQLHVSPWDALSAVLFADVIRRFVDSCLGFSCPPWEAHAVCDAYDAMRDSPSDLLSPHVRGGFEACAQRSMQAHDPTTLALCLRRLNAIDPRGYPVGDELLPAALAR